MNQIEIGRFISMVRKQKKLTQKQLAEKLGITDRAISKWENGKSMPDLSLLKPICDILGITINELLSGKYISDDKKKNNLEENIVGAINYSKKKQSINEFLFYLFILLFGILMIIISMSIFGSPIGFTIWYSLIGTYVLIIIFCGLLKKIITNNKSLKYVVTLIISFFILYFGYLWTVDFINVKKNNGKPDIFVTSYNDFGADISYDTLFYDLYICNVDKKNEYRKIVFDLNHTVDIENFDKYCK